MATHSPDGVETLLSLLERGLVSGQDVEDFLELMRAVFQLRGVVVGNEASWASWTREVGVPEGWAERYEQMKDDDPSVAFLRSAPLGTWWVLSREPQREHPVFIAAKEHGIHDCAITALPGPSRSIIKLVLFRSAEEGDFGTGQLALLGLLYPHFAGAVGSGLAVRALCMPATEGLAQALQGIRAYAYLSLPSRRVEWSATAKSFLEERLGLLSSASWLRVEDAMFAAAAQFYGAHLAGRSQPILRGIRAELAMLPPESEETHRMLVTLTDDLDASDIAPLLPASATRQRPAEAALSARQLQVARLAAAGDPVHVIARELGVSQATVRTHLRGAYTRLGINSRAELARAVLY